MDNFVFTCDALGPARPFIHFWEHTVGSGHAALALRSDWQKQLYRCRRELGFQYVRFHGLLHDDIGVIAEQKEEHIYPFFNTDQIFDFLLSINMRPFIELSFMPKTLASGEEVIFHYKGNITPPKNYDDWYLLINKLVRHWESRYGLAELRRWFFEIWNEPNLPAFWKGTQADYFKLYEYSVKAIKAVHPDLQTGGPATAKCEWIENFLDFGEKNHVPVDFVSTHHYPTDSLGQPDEDTAKQLSQVKRSILKEEAEKVKGQAHEKPVYFTEWSGSSNPFDELHDKPYMAAFIIKTVFEAHGAVNGYSYWTFSDIFEENYFSSVPFHGGFGLLSIYGVPKPAYRAFQLLHKLGNELLEVKGTHETVDLWVIRSKRKIQIMITNWALPLHAIKPETVSIKLENFNMAKSAFIERIDENSANAVERWNEMGRPQSLLPLQVCELDIASSLIKEPLKIRQEKNLILAEIILPVQGSACITLEME